MNASDTTRSTWFRYLSPSSYRTEENYRAYLRNHVVPRWGYLTLGDITALDVTAWRKDLRKRYAASHR